MATGLVACLVRACSRCNNTGWRRFYVHVAVYERGRGYAEDAEQVVRDRDRAGEHVVTMCERLRAMAWLPCAS